MKKRLSFVQEVLQRTSIACNQMKNNNIVPQDFVENKFVVLNNISEEEFDNEPAIKPGTQEMICGNITPSER